MAGFADKVVWVTGASSGIGAALARAFAAEGTRLVLSARREDALHEVAARCDTAGAAGTMVLPLDIAHTDTHADAAALVEEHFGRIDILVNNAGISQRSLGPETRFEVDRELIEVNHLGTVSLTKAVLPRMAHQRSGRIVVVSSLVGRIGTPMRTSYAASKHALHGYFDSLRAEVWDDGIRITLLCPGFIRTDLSYNALEADGSPHGVLDPGQEHGMDPDLFSRKALRAIRRGRAEAWIGGKEVLAVWIRVLCPPLYRWIARRVDPT